MDIFLHTLDLFVRGWSSVFVVLFAFGMTTILLTEVSNAAVVTVCSSSCNSTTIQVAIGLSSPYDTVMVIDNREYYETVLVNITGLNITSNSSTRPIVWSNTSDRPLTISARNVSVSRLEFKNNVTGCGPAVFSEGLSNITIVNSTARSSGTGSGCMGFDIRSANIVLLANNTVITNGLGGYGIQLISISNGNISENLISTNGTDSDNRGIYISSSTSSNFNRITNNIIFTSSRLDFNDGIALSLCDHTVISGNTINVNSTGIDSESYNSGIYMEASNNNSIFNNSITTNGTFSYGISFFSNSRRNVVNNNTLVTHSNGSYGVFFSESSNNTIKDSFINASKAFDIFSDSQGATPSVNYIVNSTFNKTDIGFLSGLPNKIFVQYKLDARVIDESGNPVAGATVFVNDTGLVSDIENPTSNLSATTNSSGHINQQVLTEFMANITYNSPSFSSLGYLYFNNYSVNATKSSFSQNTTGPIINVTKNGSISITLILINQPEPATSTSGSIVGGGGGGGSSTLVPEALGETKNVKIQDQKASIVFGKTVNHDISQMEIGLISSASAITVSVEKLADKPVSIREPAARVYSYLNISSDLPDSEIESARISFQVNSSWIIGNNINVSTVALSRYANGIWQKLPTNIVSGGPSVYAFNSTSEGFSIYAITGDEIFQPLEILEESNISGGTGAETPARGDEESEYYMSQLLIALVAILGIVAAGLYVRKFLRR